MSFVPHLNILLCPRRRGALSDTAIRPSVSLSHGAAALGYRHAGAELSMRLVHPWVRLHWVELCRVEIFQFLVGWVGLGPL